jgi:PHP domain-containing protein
MDSSPYTAAGLVPLKLEPHLHTLHSDGADSVTAMFEACHSAGYAAVALTDHNTVSGMPEAERIASALGLILVPGVEVTTFRGHAVVLGVSRAPEWRDLESRGMDALAADVHAVGGVLSVAHPAALGSPICSGCTWDWPIAPASVDFWEVFSETAQAVALWHQLLKAGGRVAPIGVGDVHSTARAAAPRPATNVYASSSTAAGVLEALRRQRTSASRGPRLDFWLQHDDGQVALVGDRVTSASWRPRAQTESGHQARFVEVPLRSNTVCIYAEVRDTQHQLEAISAPIWIQTSH